jgi:hypothetical protein
VEHTTKKTNKNARQNAKREGEQCKKPNENGVDCNERAKLCNGKGRRMEEEEKQSIVSVAIS